MKYIAALDQGTTSTRCMLFDRHASVVSSHQAEHKQIYPHAGWVEHDPKEILEKSLQCIQKAVEKAGIDYLDIAAMGITNQRETTVMWDRLSGKTYGNAIVWQDTRTSHICRQLISEGREEYIRRTTGLPVATYFSAPKIRWLIDHHPTLKADLRNHENIAFGNIDTWLIWNLTGGVNGGAHATDATNASRTMLMDLKKLQWDNNLCAILGIPTDILPEIHPSSYSYGVLNSLFFKACMTSIRLSSF